MATRSDIAAFWRALVRHGTPFRERWWDALSGGPSVFFALLAIFAQTPWAEEVFPPWAVNIWAWTIFWLAAVVCAWIAAYRVWKPENEKVLAYEELLKPMIKIIGPTFHVEPKSAKGKGHRTFRIEIENLSATTIKNCSVREALFVNRYSQQSGLRRHFRLAEEGHANMATHTYRKTFDLRGKGDREIVEIAYLNETANDTPVVMLYATEPTAQTPNAIPRHFFPHELTLLVSAENVPISEQRKFELSISSDGFLQMNLKETN